MRAGRGTIAGRRAVLLGAVLATVGASTAGCGVVREVLSRASGKAEPPAAPNPVEFPHGPLATADLLPYGAEYLTEDGTVVRLERVEGPVLDDPGPVTFADPAWVAYDEDPRPVATFRGPLAVELGVLFFGGAEDEPTAAPATVAVGDVAAVRRWEDVPDPGSGQLGFTVDAGTGIVYALSAKPAIDAMEEPQMGPLFEGALRRGSVPVVAKGRTVAVVFSCGMGDGWYPVYRGHDAAGRVVALAADLELHHHLRRREG